MSTIETKFDMTEAGLEFGLIFANYAWNTPYLHYGYFTDGLEPTPQNVLEAQERYTTFIFSHFPDDVKTVLDVGCGTGELAKQMVAKGLQVDVVSPGGFLTGKVKEKLAGSGAEVFNSFFEDVHTDKQYDLVMFSESFQYIPAQNALAQASKFCKPGGHILACDFFKLKAEGKSPIGGGHDWAEYQEEVKKHPIEELKNIDITAETAPSLDVVDDFLERFAVPASLLIVRMVEHKAPWLVKLIKWKMGKKLEKTKYKYFERNINAESFAKHKTYRLLFYKNNKK